MTTKLTLGILVLLALFGVSYDTLELCTLWIDAAVLVTINGMHESVHINLQIGIGRCLTLIRLKTQEKITFRFFFNLGKLPVLMDLFIN